MRAIALTALAVILLHLPTHADPLKQATDTIEAMILALDRGEAVTSLDQPVITTKVLTQLYSANGYVPIWINPKTVETLLTALADIENDGLDPEEYHGTTLSSLGAKNPDDGVTLAERDILLSDAFILMLYHLSYGKADPARLNADWNIDDLGEGLDLDDVETKGQIVTEILGTVADGRVEQLLDEIRPSGIYYLQMRQAYVHYRALAANGGWPSVPDGPTLREGDQDARVAILRQRLAVTDDLDPALAQGQSYDADVTTAVVHFQARHGLDDDGLVGKGTLAALNVPAAQRADELRINLERDRWVLNLDLRDFVVVNIAAFEVWLIRDRELAWKSRVQVGTTFHKTPIFTEAMTYLDVNPTWTVPASIANRAILPKVKADPGYLASQDMVLLDSKGREQDPAGVDWASVTRMPYTVRQNPGPLNALGQIKFIFPNKHAVYLHDTPSRYNFSRASRTFSSGCIRVQNPFDLATLLLDDQPEWTRERLDEVLESGKRTTVRLKEPLPVFLLYWTAYVDFQGVVQFRSDVYQRDPAVRAALDAPSAVHRHHVRRIRN